MPIKVNSIDNGIGIEIVASGIVTGEEIIEAHEEIYNERHLHQQKYHIIDRTLCVEYQVSTENIRKIAEIDKTAARINPNIIIAVVSITDLQFGMSRMWQAYVEEHIFLTEIFRDRKSADEWIKKRLCQS